MKNTKLVITNILLFLTSMNILYLFFGGGTQAATFTKGYVTSMLAPAFMLILLFACSMMINLAYIVNYAKYKKNLFRVPLLIITVLLIISIIARIKELINGVFCVSCFLNTFLYIAIFILIILMLKDLYKLVEELFKNK